MSKLTILKSYLQASYRHFKDREQLEDWQDKQVISMLEKVIAKSSYYADKFKGLDLSQWRHFPITTKQQWMDNFDGVNTVGIKKDEAVELAIRCEQTRDFTPTIKGVTVGLSSGTSGNRGLWLASPYEQSMWVGAVLAKQLPNGLLSRERIAFFLRANSNMYNAVGSSRITFKYLDMMRSIEENIKSLNEYQPTVLAAPPSILLLLINSKALHIHPKKVISIADVIDKPDEANISNYFNTRVDQIYQATEGFIATTCPQGHIHLNEDLLVVQKEWVDESTRRYVPIITDFNRMTQPIIRYRLNDVLIDGDACACGSVFQTVERIEGRQDDVLYYPNSGSLVPIFPDFIRNTIVSQTDVTEYAVRQRDYKTLDIYLTHTATIDFSKVFARCEAPTIIYHIGLPTIKPGEKMRRIRNEVQHNGN